MRISPPADSINEYVATACPGGRAPHLWVAEGRSLYDTLGFEFTLLRLGPRPPDVASFCSAAAALGLPIAIVDVGGDEARDLYGADLALIRPDQIVAWRGVVGPRSRRAAACQRSRWAANAPVTPGSARLGHNVTRSRGGAMQRDVR